MDAVPDNLVWQALNGPQRRWSAGTARVRRFARGFSPIIGFADPRQPALDELAPFCAPGEHLYCAEWTGPVPAGWRLEEEASMFRMVWTGALPPEDPDPAAVPLTAAHAAAALALAELTRPGPFGLRTIELGDYFGVFESGRLVAMAGERFHAGRCREVSGVCTHPEHRGRGHARRLMTKLVRRQLQRGETPFLHVMHDNHGAQALYRAMGFRVYREVAVRVLTPPGAPPAEAPRPPG